MSTSDGTVIGTTQIVNHGPASDRWNLVIVAEGYQQAQMALFATHAQQFVNALFATPPFDTLQCAINVFRVDVASTDEGADDPVACGGTGAVRATYFDARYCNSGIRRLLVVNNLTVLDVANAEVPQWHQILVIVNSNIHGGSGGQPGVTAVAGAWESTAIHEIGHSAFGLADEYEYWAGCGIDTTRDTHPGPEPAEPNVTKSTDRTTMKWKELVFPATPMPTTANADCTQCDPQPNPVAADTVGTFEGARYYHCAIYRPQFDCMMRNFAPFCAVCRKRIRETLTPFLGDCYAPVFKPAGCIPCLVLILVYAFVIAILSLFSWIPGVRCRIARYRYRIQNCGKGNADPCVPL